MISRTKILTFLLAGSMVSWFAWTTYNYIFDTSAPIISIIGIEKDKHYAGEVPCKIEGSDGYRVADITITLDDKAPLVKNYRINRKNFEYSFTIDTTKLPQGKHVLSVDAADGSWQRNKTQTSLHFYVDNIALQAAFVKSEGEFKVFQGRTLHIQFQTNKEIKDATVKALSQNYRCIPEMPNSLVYECFIPIKTDEAPNEYPFSIEIVDKVGNVRVLEGKFHIVLYPFKKQTLAVSNEKMKKEEELGLSEKQLQQDLADATQNSVPEKLWQGIFYVPCDQKGISTDFGTLRTSRERGKYSHDAVDFLATPRSAVWAAQDGIVVIKNRYIHSGNTIVIDHGCGLLSLYYHLENFADINVGDRVKKGNLLGTVGMTGYASGYHLHWEIRLNNISVDPMEWTKHF